MWKWIVGVLLVIVVLVIGAGWWGYHKLVAGGDSATVTVQASADRTWRLLTDPDSMSAWMRSETVALSHHGVIATGDTLMVSSTSASGNVSGRNVRWIVGELVPGKLRQLELQSDSTHLIVAVRRDSLVSMGDSTMIVTTIASPLLDSLGTTRADSGRKAGAAAAGMTSKMMVAAFRLMAEGELDQLRAFVAGRSVAAPPAAPAKP